MSGGARDFNNIEMRAIIKFFFPLQDKTPKEIHASLTETLGAHAPWYATVKNWVAQFKRGDFSTCDASRPGRHKTVTTPEIIDQIHELILEDRRTSAKSIAEQLGISCKRIGSIIHEDLDMRKLSVKWVPKCLKADQKRQRCQLSEQLMEFFRRVPNDFLSRLVTITKPGYITMTRRQSNYQWSGGIGAHPAPKNSGCKNPLEKFSPRFCGIKKAFFLLIAFQRANDNDPAHRALATQKKLFYLGFQCLDHPPYSQHLAPSDYHLSPGLKKQLKVRHFSSEAESLLPRIPGWTDNILNFFEWLAKVRTTG